MKSAQWVLNSPKVTPDFRKLPLSKTDPSEKHARASFPAQGDVDISLVNGQVNRASLGISFLGVDISHFEFQKWAAK